MKRRIWPIFGANIFLSLHYATVLYVNSTFLGQFFSPPVVSLLFVAGALWNIMLFLLGPRFLRTFGLKKTYLFFIAVTGLALFGLAYSAAPLAAALLFIVYAGTLFMISYCLDVFLEDQTLNKHTGGMRGLYLTIGSSAIASAPLFLTLLVRDDNLAPVYMMALLLLIVPFFFGVFYLRAMNDRVRAAILAKSSVLPFRAWWHADSVRRATIVRFTLEIFYALMVIYTPLYLRNVLGFQWSELGIIFAVMLLPFVIFEWPVGELEDRKLGEKEVMSAGLFIIGMSLIAMPFLDKSFFVWMGVLFLSRVGASFTEVSTESHFFKHVDSRDTSLISIYRLSRPMGIIAGSILGGLTILLFPMNTIFLVVAAVVFLGLRQSLYLKDTL